MESWIGVIQHLALRYLLYNIYFNIILSCNKMYVTLRCYSGWLQIPWYNSSRLAFNVFWNAQDIVENSFNTLMCCKSWIAMLSRTRFVIDLVYKLTYVKSILNFYHQTKKHHSHSSGTIELISEEQYNDCPKIYRHCIDKL